MDDADIFEIIGRRKGEVVIRLWFYPKMVDASE
jgi:hypothetical protein